MPTPRLRKHPPVYRLWLVACLLLLSTPLTAQHAALRFDRLTVDDGLSYSTIWSLHQDDRGFLWVGTGAGLNRYDGYQFKIYKHDPDDPKSLSNSGISALTTDRQGRLWVGTQRGLNQFQPDTESFLHFDHDPEAAESLSDDFITSLLEDHSGILWVGTNSGLNRFDRESGTSSRFQHDASDPTSLGSDEISDLLEDRDGTLWVGTSGGLNRFDRSTETFSRFLHDPQNPQSLSHDATFNIAQSPDGLLWISTQNGLNALEPRDGTVTRYLHDPSNPEGPSAEALFSLAVEPSGKLWVATADRGLSRFDPMTGVFDHHRHDAVDPRSLISDLVTDIYVDRSGVLWAGSYSGVSKYDPRRDVFKTYRRQSDREPTFSGTSAWAVQQTRSGIVWLGTEQGLDRFDPRQGMIDSFEHDPGDPRSLQNGPLTTLLEDRAGDFWVGTWGGLSRWDPGGGFIHYPHDPDDPDTLGNPLVQYLFEDSSDRLWVGTLNGLSYLDRAAGRFVRYPTKPTDPPFLADDTIYAILEDHTGTLWFGTRDNGLLRLDPGPEGRFVQYLPRPDDADSLSGHDVASLHEDRSGALWIGTNGAGLNRLDPARKRFVRYHERDGLAGESVVGILEDDEGGLWLATHGGLSRFDSRTETFTNYDVADGLPNNDFAMVSSHRGPEGEMFFGGISGLTAFFPDHVASDLTAPPVVITDFRLFNHSVRPRAIDPESPLEGSILDATDLTLTHRDYVFGFEFAGLHYSSPRQNRYAYRLEGFDRDWIETTADQRFAQYSNLSAGEYTFRVKASNDDGVWNTTGTSLRIKILPPPWKTWWAYTLYFLAVSTAIVAYLRWQQNKVERERAINHQLREVDRLKDEFLANTSHELRTPLYGIVGIAESLIDGAAGEITEEVEDNLGMVVTSGRRLSSLINDILDFSKLTGKSLKLHRQPVDLRTLTDVVVTLSRPLIGAKNLELVNAIDTDLPAADADEDRLQQILHNLIGNAIKFTESGRVEISAVVDGHRVVTHVTDTGPGIPEEHQDRIFASFEQVEGSAIRRHGGTGLGLAVTKQLVSLHGGTLWVESKMGEGSTFSFSLPIAKRGTADKPPAPAADGSSRVIETDSERAPRAIPGERTPGDRAATLLIVDDEPVIRQVLLNYLSRDYRLLCASSGAEALRLLAEQPVDLVLLDVMMPKMSGYEVCRSLRRDRSIEELPVIFLTAKTQVADLVSGMAAGANDYLTKPVARDELLARVATHLALRSINRELSEMVAERTAQIEEREELLSERTRLISLLEARNDELARFNYTVAHDLKNPLTTIRNYIGILERDAETGDRERLKQDLQRIDGAAAQLTRQLDELYEFSRISHQINPFEDVPFGALVHEVLETFRETLDARGIEVTVASGLPTVHGDRPRLSELTKHLLDNAIRYMGDSKSPRIEVGIRAEAAKTGERVLFVRDNGQGIAPRYREKVFDLFERLSPRESAGTGIGLTLVKRVVEIHGGRIWVESEGRGRGATFCFTLSGAPSK